MYFDNNWSRINNMKWVFKKIKKKWKKFISVIRVQKYHPPSMDFAGGKNTCGDIDVLVST